MARSCLLAWGFVTLCALPACPADDDKLAAQLQPVVRVLKEAIKDLDPRPDVKTVNKGQGLELAIRTQVYKIHHVAKSGQISPDTHDEVGPSHDGFVLKVHLQKRGEVNQAVTPCTIHKPYWTMDLDVTPLADSRGQLYWALSYGARTDEKLLQAMRQALRGLSK